MMKDLPNPFWALLFIVLGCVLLLAVLVKINASTTTVMLGVLMAVATAGTSIIAGAFGYIQGQKAAEHSLQIPINPNPASQTTATVTSTNTANPTDPNTKQGA